MSAWPQAVWIVREIQNQFNLNQRVLYLENRYYIFAPVSSVLDSQGKKQPELPEEYQDIKFSDDSIWFVGNNQTEDDQIIRNVYAISLYHTENEEGHWSDFLNFSIDSDALYLNGQDPDFQDEIWDGARTIQDALKALAAAIKVASGSSGTIAIPSGEWVGDGGTGWVYIKQDGPNCGSTPTISLSNADQQNQKRAFEFIDYVLIDENDNTRYTFHAIQKPTVNLSFKISAY